MLRSDIALSSRPHSLGSQTGKQTQGLQSPSLWGVWKGQGGKTFPFTWALGSKGKEDQEVTPELCQSPENKAETLATAGRSGMLFVYLGGDCIVPGLTMLSHPHRPCCGLCPSSSLQSRTSALCPARMPSPTLHVSHPAPAPDSRTLNVSRPQLGLGT